MEVGILSKLVPDFIPSFCILIFPAGRGLQPRPQCLPMTDSEYPAVRQWEPRPQCLPPAGRGLQPRPQCLPMTDSEYPAGRQWGFFKTMKVGDIIQICP